MNKPDIRHYHDYRLYLKDRIAFEKESRPRFSLRKLSEEVKVAPGFLPMFLSGDRSISSEMLERVGAGLGLNQEERKYLQGLRTIAESQSQDLRLEALEELQKSRGYRESNPKELEVRQYLTEWFNIVIRELVNVDGFKWDPKWIRSRLRVKVPLSSVEKAMGFLLENGFVRKDGGRMRVVNKKLECTGEIFRLVFGQFHREMLKLASEALDTVPHAERSITGLTFPIPVNRFGEVFKILDETLDRIDALSADSKGADAVYHVGISLFPLTQMPKLK